MRKNLNDFVRESAEIDIQFKNRWPIETRVVNLAEEVGELAHDVLVIEKKKKDKMIAETIQANLSNLLYEVFLIADNYKVDLDKEWDRFRKVMPSWAKKRNK